jgi:pimeloyl-ACP methyl ester carboxylesterase
MPRRTETGRPLADPAPIPASTHHSVTATAETGCAPRQADFLLIMVPGMGMTVRDFDTQGLIAAVDQSREPIAIATVDPGLDAYLDGSIETRLLDGIAETRDATGANRIWLVGVSLGCQAILPCIRVRPDLAEGVILLTPYLASTGLIAEIRRMGGIRRWSESNAVRQGPERALLTWLATTPPAEVPRMLVGHARNDRFATTATMLADLLPAGQVISVPGEHDWASWRALWRVILDRNPFERPAPVAP